MKRTGWKVLFLVLLAAWMALIFSFSAQPAEASSDVSGSLTETVLAVIVPGYTGWETAAQEQLLLTTEIALRKLAHFTLYTVLGGLAFLSACTFWDRRRLRFLLAWGLCVLYAVSDELHQTFVPGRSGELRDVCIDSAGALCGALFCVLLVWGIRRLIQRRKPKKIKV